MEHFLSRQKRFRQKQIFQILTPRLGYPRKSQCPGNSAPEIPDFYHDLSSILHEILDFYHGLSWILGDFGGPRI